jgi:hypothetical protein
LCRLPTTVAATELSIPASEWPENTWATEQLIKQITNQQTKPILTKTEITAIDVQIYAAKNIDHFMHDVVYALLEATWQRGRKDKTKQEQFVLNMH